MITCSEIVLCYFYTWIIKLYYTLSCINKCNIYARLKLAILSSISEKNFNTDRIVDKSCDLNDTDVDSKDFLQMDNSNYDLDKNALDTKSIAEKRDSVNGLDENMEDTRDLIQKEDSDHEVEENAGDETDVEEGIAQIINNSEYRDVSVKQERVSDGEENIHNEKVYIDKDTPSAEELITNFNHSIRKSKSMISVKSREKEKRKLNTLSPVRTSKRSCTFSTFVTDREVEVKDDQSRASDLSKNKDKVTLSNEFYKELETLPGIIHYSEKLRNADIKIETDDDASDKAIKDVDTNGYSLVLSAYFCKDCEYIFPEQNYFARHKLDGKCIFSCQLCKEQFSFRNYTQYQEHLKTHR